MLSLNGGNIENNTREKTIVLFRADWSPNSREFKPEFDSYDCRVRVKLAEAVINEEENQLWGMYKIKEVPTIIAFEKGKEIGRVNGKRQTGLLNKDMDSLLKMIA
ncbi:MAG: thioredoxin family protein [Candidatus Micrarchaeales archaeon]